MNEHQLETYKSLITIAVESFKFSALINGGAAVAILAYLGNAAGKGAAFPDMRVAMAWFLGGLFLCGAAFLSAYITQLVLFSELYQPPPQTRHAKFLYIAIVLLILSLFAFGVGSWQAVERFR